LGKAGKYVYFTTSYSATFFLLSEKERKKEKTHRQKKREREKGHRQTDKQRKMQKKMLERDK